MTVHHMRLQPIPFRKIALGLKTIELRLNDEKRRTLQVHDRILFQNLGDPRETILTAVSALHVFQSFTELYAALPLEQCGYTTEELKHASAHDMDVYYTQEEQKKNGVVGIELVVLSR